jgi:hypothetical protein
MLGFSPLASSPLATTGDSSVSVSVDVTGVSATGNLGTVAVNLQLNVNVTGTSATGQLGNSTVTVPVNAVVTFDGWGRGGWGELAFGEGSIGVQAVGEVGNVTVSIGVDVGVTGVQATGQLGNVAVTTGVVISAVGVEATGAIGSVTVEESVQVTVTGTQGTTALGNTVVNADGAVNALGNAATGELGSIVVSIGRVVNVTGVEGTGAVGTPDVGLGASVFPTGVSAEASTLNNGSPFTADGDAQLSTAQAKFGSASLLLDGADDFVASDENIDLSSGDFTVDMWIRPTNVTGYKGIWQTGTSTTEQSYLLGNQVYWVVNPSTIISSSVTVSAGV